MLVKLVLGNKQRLYQQGLTISKISGFIKQQFSFSGPFHLEHIDSSLRSTRIESDSDLLGLKYLTKGSSLTLEIVLEKSEQHMYNQLVSEMVGNNLNCIYMETIKKIEDQESQRQTKKYLSNLYSDVSSSISYEMERERMIKDEVDEYMHNLTRNSERNVQRNRKLRRYDEEITFCRLMPKENIKNGKKMRFSIEKIREQEQISNQKSVSESEKHIAEIVSSKIEELIPTLVDSIYNKLKRQMKIQKQMSMKKNGCPGCSSQSQDFEDFINRQIRKKCRKSVKFSTRDDISIGCQSFNPEE